jgi:hypothetical protein
MKDLDQVLDHLSLQSNLSVAAIQAGAVACNASEDVMCIVHRLRDCRI